MIVGMSEGSIFDNVEIIRSTRRVKTIDAKYVGDKIVVRVPAHMPPELEARQVARIVARLREKARNALSDTALAERAQWLNERYLEGRAEVGGIRWVSNQTTRWGSCTKSTREIRINDALRDVPQYVLDSVIIHEMVHTFVRGGHTAEFWEWADRAPKAERVKGYLEAYARWVKRD